MEGRTSLKRQWNPKAVFAISLVIFAVAALFAAEKACAAYTEKESCIGVSYNDTTGGKSTVGVRVSRISPDNKTSRYALDTWEKSSSGSWDYKGSNIDGNIEEVVSSDTSPVYIAGNEGRRFGININKIKEELPEKGSIIIKKYRYGECIYKRAEYTYQTGDENKIDISESLLKQAAKGTEKFTLHDTIYGSDGVSYLYDIYDAIEISQSGRSNDIFTDLEDCKIKSAGYAYYGVEGAYIIKELPEAEHNTEEGYIYNFRGWYKDKEGGNKVYAGSRITPGTTIYPQWDITRKQYNVNYIDILGDSPEGKVLAATNKTLYYNDEASGADIGSNKEAGAYYKGLYYTGCTSATVKEDCTVYRYFRPAVYNIIFNGNMAVSGITEPLYNCIYGETYNLPENAYKRNGTVTLDLNAADAVCSTSSINVVYEFAGWAETASGNAVYKNCGSISGLCTEDSEKQLYAVWEGGAIEAGAIPLRAGYSFAGWAVDKDSVYGSTCFDVSGSNNRTLYAIWKPLEAEGGTGEDISGGNNSGVTSGGSIEDTGGNGNIENENTEDRDDTENGDGTEDSGGTTDINTENTGTGSTVGISTGGSIDTESNGNATGGGIEDNGDNTGSGPGIVTGENTGSSGNSSGSTGGSGGSSGGGNWNSGGSSGGFISGGSSGSSGGGSTGAGGSSSTGSSGSPGSSSSASGSSSPGNNSSGNGSTFFNEDNKVASGSSITTGKDNKKPAESTGGDSKTTGSNSAGGNALTKNPDKTDSNKTGNKKQDKSSISTSKKAVYPKAGKKYKKAGIIYKVIKSNSKKRTVKVTGTKKGVVQARIPGYIKINGYKYKVVSIGKNAFKKCKKLKKAVIGKNIKSIGKKAFYKNKKLEKIVIKSKKLKSIGSGAFKQIKPKCVVKIAGDKKYAQKVFTMMNT